MEIIEMIKGIETTNFYIVMFILISFILIYKSIKRDIKKLDNDFNYKIDTEIIATEINFKNHSKKNF